MAGKKKIIRKKKVTKKKGTKKVAKKKVSKKTPAKKEDKAAPTGLPCAICGTTDGIHLKTCFKHFMLGQHEK